IGMKVITEPDELSTAYQSVVGVAEKLFGDPTILAEEYLRNARHVEIQVLGLADGTVVALGERECSVQRRHQKVVEETPSMALDDALREEMCSAAVVALEALGYRNAGTVECLVSDGRFVFLEVNSRLQVE